MQYTQPRKSLNVRLNIHGKQKVRRSISDRNQINTVTLSEIIQATRSISASNWQLPAQFLENHPEGRVEA